MGTNGEKRNVYRILVGKPERKRPLGRPRHRWVDSTVSIVSRGCTPHVVCWGSTNATAGPSDTAVEFGVCEVCSPESAVRSVLTDTSSVDPGVVFGRQAVLLAYTWLWTHISALSLDRSAHPVRMCSPSPFALQLPFLSPCGEGQSYWVSLCVCTLHPYVGVKCSSGYLSKSSKTLTVEDIQPLRSLPR
jgi:hypothetical protein